MADRPLRTATDRRLGEPLPHQQANQTRDHPRVAEAFPPEGVCGISPSFPRLSPAPRQIAHVLLTRPPLYSRAEARFLARLACVRHAASVHSEPGSNSPVKNPECRRSANDRQQLCYKLTSRPPIPPPGGKDRRTGIGSSSIQFSKNRQKPLREIFETTAAGTPCQSEHARPGGPADRPFRGNTESRPGPWPCQATLRS